MKTWFSVKAAVAADQPDEIDIFDEIGYYGVSAKSFIDKLRSLNANNITLSINSPGGDVFAGIAIYNALRNSGKNVTVRVLGVAASAASLIAMAGNKIVMPENSFLMVHNPWTFAMGNAEELRDTADVLDKIGASLTATYVARTGQSEEDVKKLLAEETWLSAEDAVAMGFADEVEPLLKVAASFDLDRLPEHIKAAITPEPVAEGWDGISGDEPAQVAEDIAATQAIHEAAVAAGMQEHAVMMALAFGDLESAQAFIAQAGEIKAMCAFAGMQDMADGFIKDRASLVDVRAALLDALASKDEANHTDGLQPSDGTPQDAKPTASITTANIWASRRKS